MYNASYIRKKLIEQSAFLETRSIARCSPSLATFVRFWIDRIAMIEMLSVQNGLANRDARSRVATMFTYIRWVTCNCWSRRPAAPNIYMPTAQPENIVSQVHTRNPDPPQRQCSMSTLCFRVKLLPCTFLTIRHKIMILCNDTCIDGLINFHFVFQKNHMAGFTKLFLKMKEFWSIKISYTYKQITQLRSSEYII